MGRSCFEVEKDVSVFGFGSVMFYGDCMNSRLRGVTWGQLLLFFALLAYVSFQDFSFAYGDDTIQIAILNKMRDSGLYKYDFLINYEYRIYPLFFLGFVNVLVGLFGDVFVTYAILSYVMRFVFISGCYFLTRKLFSSHRKAVFTSVLFALSYAWIAPATTEGLSLMFVLPRTFVLAFIPWVLYLYFRNTGYVFFFGLGILFNFHPISLLPFVVLFFLEALKDKGVREVVRYASVFLVSVIPTVYGMYAAAPLTGGHTDLSLLSRVSYLFMPFWEFVMYYKAGIVLFLFFLSLGGFGMYFSSKKGLSKRFFCWSVFMILYAAVYFVLPFFGNVNLLRFLQPLRALTYVLFFSVLFAGEFVFMLCKSRDKLLHRMIVVFVIFAIFCGSFTGRTLLKHHSFAKENLDIYEQDIIGWAKTTDVDSMFVFPRGYPSSVFRAVAKRGIVVSNKDGAIISYSKQYALAWLERMNAVSDLYDASNVDDVKKMADKYNVSHFVVRRGVELSFPVAHQNEKFVVYDVI